MEWHKRTWFFGITPLDLLITVAVLLFLAGITAPKFIAIRGGVGKNVEVDEAAAEWGEFLKNLESKSREERKLSLDARAARFEENLRLVEEARALLDIYDSNEPNDVNVVEDNSIGIDSQREEVSYDS